MRRLLRLAAWLYPPAWRTRYGAEFAALLEDSEPGWHDLLDILKGALTMQLTSTNSRKLAGAVTILGGLLALPVAHWMPERYTSQAALRLTARDATPPGQVRDLFDQISAESLSRGSLTEIVQKPSLDLYKDLRRRLPMGDVVGRMRRDIRIRYSASPDGKGVEIAVDFTYPNRYKAQAVIRELVTRFTEANVTAARSGTFRGAENLEVVAPANLPETPVPADIWPMVGGGLFGGLLVGALLALAARSRPLRILKFAGLATAGFAVAACLAYLIPDRWTSTAVVRPIALEPFREKVLGGEILSGVIAAARLYPEEHNGAVARMRRDLQVIPVTAARPQAGTDASGKVYQIRFTYAGDRYKAQDAVRRIVDDLETTPGTVFEPHSPSTLPRPLEILDLANLPEAPSSPNRLAIAAAGALAGLVAGIAWQSWRRRPGPAAAA
jgi:hypothetical protein